MPAEIPYPGPRFFEAYQENLFHGREREKRELLSLLIAHRAVVLYAQSGAGKTSLINAGVLPLLKREGIETLPIARVGLPVPAGVHISEIRNIYVFNALQSWVPNTADPRALLSTSIAASLQEHAKLQGTEQERTPRIIILDQFEELFTTYAERWAERKAFLDELAQALEEDPFLRLLLCLREDHFASLDPHAPLFPERLRTRYRLERLRRDAACLAVKNPIQHTRRRFAPGVVEQLVDELLQIRVEDARGEATTVTGEYVEPVQLQIVCKNLWENLRDDEELITSSHLETYGDVDKALIAFYEKTLAATAEEAKVPEVDLRNWFEDHLITQAGTRGTVFSGPIDTGGIPNKAVAKLEHEHLIRAETRAGSRWYELTHDRFIDPIEKSNKPWRERFELERAKKEAERIRTEITWKWGKIVAAVVALITLVGIGLWERQARVQAEYKLAMLNAPWGYLADLHTSEVHELKGQEMKLGRNVEGVINDIVFANRFYSRRHLIIRRDHTAEDLRSRNGTTINGQLLRYGITAKLSDNDIITLANIRALQFTTTAPRTTPNPQPGTWAIFLDSSRSYHYLTDPQYVLHLVNGEVSLQKGDIEAALMKVHWNNGRAELLDAADEWQIILTVKETDYNYRTYPLGSTEKWIDVPNGPLQFVKLSRDRKKILEEGPSFQIVLFKEPPCCRED